MQKDSPDRDQLKLLRKFAVPGVYSPAYLSQLVQRGKLKAKRIGRNFYTCETWFDEYLDRHAQDAKCEAIREQRSAVSASEAVSEANRVKDEIYTNRPVNLVISEDSRLNPGKKTGYKTAVILMAVFSLLILLSNLFIYFDSHRGTISGVSEEAGVDMATSTVMEAGKIIR